MSLQAVTRSAELVTTGLVTPFFTRASTRDDGSSGVHLVVRGGAPGSPFLPDLAGRKSRAPRPFPTGKPRWPIRQIRHGGDRASLPRQILLDAHKHLPHDYSDAMKQLNFELKNLCFKNRDGSHSTQANRHEMLQQIAGELDKLGFKHMRATSLKQKHVEALVKSWHERGLSAGRMKNLMAVMRWWAGKAGVNGAVASANDTYGIDRRIYVSNSSKAATAPGAAKESISDPYVRASIELQAVFGLRREEAIKFSPSYADKGSHIVLKGSWTKGGRPRIVPISTEAQRAALTRAHEVAGKGSLIPPSLRYVDQLRRYEGQVAAAGLSKLHGLRHTYAQQRYLELTGRFAPAAGGKTSVDLTIEEKRVDLIARLQISQELGHEREQITAVYLGR